MQRGRARGVKLSQAELDRLAALATALGVEIAIVEAAPGTIRLITTAGQRLTAADDDVKLDAELAEWRAGHGDGQS